MRIVRRSRVQRRGRVVAVDLYGLPVHARTLEVLRRHPGQSVHKGRLCEQVWGADNPANRDNLRVQIERIRNGDNVSSLSRLRPGERIVTEHRVGYRLVVEAVQ